jgi:hypothetical protein
VLSQGPGNGWATGAGSGRLGLMKVTEIAIEKVVANAAAHIAEDNYISVQVGRMRSDQPHITQYVIAHQAELTVEGVVTTLFHASLLHRGLCEANGRSPGVVDFAALDRAATAVASLEQLAEEEPHMASYVASNIDLPTPKANEVAGKVLAHIGKALADAS